jgi:cellulose biosynthesis protein BcsQ
LLFAEEIVIPVGMDLMAVIGARQTFNGVLQVRDLWPERRLELLAVLPMFVHSGNHATRATLEALEQDAALGKYVFRPGIRQCIDLNYATASHQTIWEYAPRSRAADDYSSLIDYIETGSMERSHETGDPYASQERSRESTFKASAAHTA